MVRQADNSTAQLTLFWALSKRDVIRRERAAITHTHIPQNLSKTSRETVDEDSGVVFGGVFLENTI